MDVVAVGGLLPDRRGAYHAREYSPAGAQGCAIIRGRFVELLGQAVLAAKHTDNLFLTGMFSVLEEVLGLPLEELMASVLLPEAVQQAIVSRTGNYGPFLELALACEEGGDDVASIAERLCIGVNHVNAAHLEAIAWTQEIDRAAR